MRTNIGLNQIDWAVGKIRKTEIMVYQGPHRKPNRLPGYDYSQAGWYFVTICAKDRECLFGDINGGKMVLNELGKIAEQFWLDIPKHFNNAKLDEYVIMPNHIHGIVVIIGSNMVGNGYIRSLQPGQRQQALLPKIIGTYKAAATRQSRKMDNRYIVWQKSYYDHIIRNENALNAIRHYIQTNPNQWNRDRNNPDDVWI